jgi:hypothetical protein
MISREELISATERLFEGESKFLTAGMVRRDFIDTVIERAIQERYTIHVVIFAYDEIVAVITQPQNWYSIKNELPLFLPYIVIERLNMRTIEIRIYLPPMY